MQYAVQDHLGQPPLLPQDCFSECILFTAHLLEINQALLLAHDDQRTSRDSWGDSPKKRRMFYLETNRGGHQERDTVCKIEVLRT